MFEYSENKCSNIVHTRICVNLQNSVLLTKPEAPTFTLQAAHSFLLRGLLCWQVFSNSHRGRSNSKCLIPCREELKLGLKNEYPANNINNHTKQNKFSLKFVRLNIYLKKNQTRLGLQCQTPLIPYPLSLPLVPYPLVLFLSRNLGGGSCHCCCHCLCHCCYCYPKQSKVRLDFDKR